MASHDDKGLVEVSQSAGASASILREMADDLRSAKPMTAAERQRQASRLDLVAASQESVETVSLAAAGSTAVHVTERIEAFERKKAIKEGLVDEDGAPAFKRRGSIKRDPRESLLLSPPADENANPNTTGGRAPKAGGSATTSAAKVAGRGATGLTLPAALPNSPLRPAPHQPKRHRAPEKTGKTFKKKLSIVLPMPEPGAAILSAHQVGKFMSEQKGTHTALKIIEELRAQKMVPSTVSDSRLQNLKAEYDKLKPGGRVG